MIFAVLMMGLVLVAAAALVLILYLAKKADEKAPAANGSFGPANGSFGPANGSFGPGPAGPAEPKTILDGGYVWNDTFVNVEFERDPLPGGLIDQRPSVEGTTTVYKKLYLKGTPNCTKDFDAQARMVPEKPAKPEFLVYYAPDAASVCIARRDCLDTELSSKRYLAAVSKTEIDGDTSQNNREEVRKRNTEIGIELFFSKDPFPWTVVAHDVPEKTMSLAPKYNPDLFVGVEKKISTVSSTDPHEFRVVLTLGKASYLYDRFKVRFSE